MAKIARLKAREILDSRGNPTVEVDLFLDNGIMGRAAVPSGASTGVHEMLELRDGDSKRYLGNGVLKAVDHVQTTIADAVMGMDPADQSALDQRMLELDGTDNKSHLGANAILGVSMAALKAAAADKSVPLYQHVADLVGNTELRVPQIMFNVLNGGKHANWATDVQEYFIIPRQERFTSVRESVRAGAEIYHALKSILKSQHYNVAVGDEGGFAPQEMTSNTEPIDILLRAIEKAGYTPREDIVLGFDAAASEFYENGKYELKKEGKSLTALEWTAVVTDWCNRYPIFSLEDMHQEDDFEGWQSLMQAIGNTHQIVGDDLLVTNVERIRLAMEKAACNALLVKVNQIGSITETFAAIALTQSAGWGNVFSHRSGETEDTTIADLVVGTGTGQIKTGAPARGERTAKYNQLLRIEESL